MMTTREDTLDIIPNDFMRFVKNGRVIQGTWKKKDGTFKKENHKIYADWFGKKEGFKTWEDWYEINTGIINKTYGSGLIKCYGGSLFLFLKNVYPKYNWLEWKFTKTPQNTWVNKDGIFKMENHIKYVLWLGLTLDFKCQNDWYKLTSEVIYTNNGGGLLHKCYEGSCYLLLKSVFPKDNWLGWLFTTSPYNFWNLNTEKEYANWLGKKKGFKNEEDWYNISREILIENNGGGYILNKYNGSPVSFVMNVFPDYNWLQWKFHITGLKFWQDKKNHKKFADWLGEEEGFKNEEDWYNITSEIIIKHGGSTLFLNYYKGSPYLFVSSIYEDINWVQWKFKQVGKKTWVNKDGTFNIKNHKKFADWLGEEVGFKNKSDWYNITLEVIQKNNGGGLIGKYYNDSPRFFVTSIYPDYPWDLSKFKKNYSQGQIEWLNCLIIKKYPDIRHALNHDKGEYSIPNSLYHADGYSKTKNTILEYNGDYYHGNPNWRWDGIKKSTFGKINKWKKYKPEELNKITKTTYGELYQKTLEKQRFCEESGYNYISIWESEWFRFKNSIIQLQRIFKEKQEANV
jgi:hypothetical protein